MGRRTLIKVVACVLAGAATICLMAPPASANTVDVTVSESSVEFYDADDALVITADTPGVTSLCSPAATGALSATGSSTVGPILWWWSWHWWVYWGGVWWVVSWYWAFTGTYANINSTSKAVSMTGDVQLTMHRAAGPTSCIPSGSFGDCTVTASGVQLDGVLQHSGAMPALVAGDTLDVGGASGPSSLSVSGGVTNCGVMITANNGYITVPGQSIEVT